MQHALEESLRRDVKGLKDHMQVLEQELLEKERALNACQTLHERLANHQFISNATIEAKWIAWLHVHVQGSFHLHLSQGGQSQSRPNFKESSIKIFPLAASPSQLFHISSQSILNFNQSSSLSPSSCEVSFNLRLHWVPEEHPHPQQQQQHMTLAVAWQDPDNRGRWHTALLVTKLPILDAVSKPQPVWNSFQVHLVIQLPIPTGSERSPNHSDLQLELNELSERWHTTRQGELQVVEAPFTSHRIPCLLSAPSEHLLLCLVFELQSIVQRSKSFLQRSRPSLSSN